MEIHKSITSSYVPLIVPSIERGTTEEQIKFQRHKTELRLKNNFCLTIVEAENLVRSQNNSCAICLKQFEWSRDAKIDHDHKTGRVRGILCPQCNTGLGFFKDNPFILRNAIRYLEKPDLKLERKYKISYN